MPLLSVLMSAGEHIAHSNYTYGSSLSGARTATTHPGRTHAAPSGYTAWLNADIWCPSASAPCSCAQVSVDVSVGFVRRTNRSSPLAPREGTPFTNGDSSPIDHFVQNRGNRDLRTVVLATCVQDRPVSTSARALRALERVHAAWRAALSSRRPLAALPKSAILRIFACPNVTGAKSRNGDVEVCDASECVLHTRRAYRNR